jgi:hypothetical protein
MYLNRLRSGDRVRARKDVTGSVQEAFTFGNNRTGLSRKNRRISAGEEFTFIRHQQGCGSDPAYEVILLDTDKRQVTIQVGWFHLREEDWEAL